MFFKTKSKSKYTVNLANVSAMRYDENYLKLWFGGSNESFFMSYKDESDARQDYETIEKFLRERALLLESGK